MGLIVSKLPVFAIAAKSTLQAMFLLFFSVF